MKKVELDLKDQLENARVISRSMDNKIDDLNHKILK